jgi:hypothetical protein
LTVYNIKLGISGRKHDEGADEITPGALDNSVLPEFFGLGQTPRIGTLEAGYSIEPAAQQLAYGSIIGMDLHLITLASVTCRPVEYRQKFSGKQVTLHKGKRSSVRRQVLAKFPELLEEVREQKARLIFGWRRVERCAPPNQGNDYWI